MRIAAPTTPGQVDTDTRRAVAELQRAARANASQADLVTTLKVAVFGDADNTIRPMALVKRSTAVSPNSGVDTIPTFDSSALVDTDGMYDPATPDRLIVQTPGTYLTVGQVPYTSNGTGIRAAYVLALGTSPVSNAIGANTTAGLAAAPNLMQAISPPVPLDAGSTLFLSLYQTSGGALSTLTTYGACWLAAIFLAPMP